MKIFDFMIFLILSCTDTKSKSLTVTFFCDRHQCLLHERFHKGQNPQDLPKDVKWKVGKSC